MVSLRRATAEDAQALIEFNCAMALETEKKELLPDVIAAGVNTLLRDPSAGFYVVAEAEGQVIGALMLTKEWSDWRKRQLLVDPERLCASGLPAPPRIYPALSPRAAASRG